MKVLAHAIAPGKPREHMGLWEIDMHVEYEDGSTGIEAILVPDKEDIALIQKHFKSQNGLTPVIVEI